MFADIIVLTYQAPGIGYFTYKIPDGLKGKIKVGHLVKVPFGKRTPLGIVITLHKSHPEQREGSRDSSSPTQNDQEKDQDGSKIVFKPISEIVLPNPLIPLHLINLLKWMAEYYHAPMVNCLEAMLPDIPKKLQPYSSSNSREVSSRRKFSTSSNNNPYQTLVLVPNINRIPETLAKYPHAKNHVLYHNQLKASEKFAVWMKILEGKADFIFGSRSAIFTPCPKLKKIIIYDEHEGAYKDERSPYHDTLTIAEKLTELTGAKLEIIDSSPKITTFFNHPKEVILRDKNPQDLRPDHQIKTFIVSMSDERRSGNKGFISYMLSDFIRRNLRVGGKTLLFLNKKAESGQFFCRSCNFQEFMAEKPKMCPNCKSYDFFFASANIFTLAEQLKKEVQIIPKLIAVDKPFQPFYSPSPVDIATSYIFYSQTFRRYQLVAHLSADSVLARADFTSPEQFYAQVENLKKLTTVDGVLLLQSYNSQDEYLLHASVGDYPSFYKKNLAERKTLSFPPFVLLAKLTIRGKSKEKIEEKAHILYSKIQEARDEDMPILGPYPTQFTRGLPEFNIILKKKVSSYNIKVREKAGRELRKYFQLADRDWQITIEPESLN